MKMLDDVTPKEWDAVWFESHSDLIDDPVDRPAHYNKGGIEAIDYIDQQLGEGSIDYCLGNTHKYLHRWRYKNGIEDLKKARWYLDRMITTLEKT